MTSLPIFVIARLTIREATRRRLLLAVVLLTVVFVGFSAWGFERLTSISCGSRPCSPTEVKLVAATLLILLSFMYSFVFTVGAVFVSAPSIASEVESGVALAMLPRSVRRSDVVLGKWLGWALMIGGYTVLTMSLEFIAVDVFAGYMPPYPVTAIAFLVGEGWVMLTLGMLGSTRLGPMTGGIVALVFFGFAWIGGIAHGIGTALGAEAVSNVGFASSIILPTDGLWRGALYHLEPTLLTGGPDISRAMAANPFLTLNPPSAGYIVWAVAWTAAMLALAVFSFERREV